jgi:hypothetical protein
MLRVRIVQVAGQVDMGVLAEVGSDFLLIPTMACIVVADVDVGKVKPSEQHAFHAEPSWPKKPP